MGPYGNYGMPWYVPQGCYSTGPSYGPGCGPMAYPPSYGPGCGPMPYPTTSGCGPMGNPGYMAGYGGQDMYRHEVYRDGKETKGMLMGTGYGMAAGAAIGDAAGSGDAQTTMMFSGISALLGGVIGNAVGGRRAVRSDFGDDCRLNGSPMFRGRFGCF